MTAKTIYKICTIAEWSAALFKGEFEGSDVDLADGFIHFSTADQVRETAARHFAGAADLYLLVVDATQFGDDLKWEPSRGGDLFPHLYGKLPTKAVASVHPLQLGEDGKHLFPTHVGADT